MIRSCIAILQALGAADQQNLVPMYMKNGAFDCVQAVVCKGMEYAQKIEVVQSMQFLEVIEHFKL